MVCLDTSVLIDYLRGEKIVVDLVADYAKGGKLSTTSITEYELLKHTDKIKRDIAMELLSGLKIYYFDNNAAEASAGIYHDLKTDGVEINENDIFIAGIASSNNELLITRDKGFSRIGRGVSINIL